MEKVGDDNYMSNEYFIGQLKEKYKNGSLIPFIGAGLSMPFNVPDWSNLIWEYASALTVSEFPVFHELIKMELSKYEYWEALRQIKRYAKRNDQDIQEYICNKVNNSINLNISDNLHNYADLANMGFDSFLTTNYDHILSRYLETNFNSINLKDLGSSTQNILNDGQKRIFHLHGNISQQDSIVMTEETYRELYESRKYSILFSLFAGTKTFLFLGFSFNDIFIQKIIKELNEFFKSKHYILLNNPEDKQVEWLKNNFNIETIVYDGSVSSHAEEIRKILKQITSDNGGKAEQDKLAEGVMEYLLENIPDSEEKKQLEQFFFCKKLRLENIDDKVIDYSKNCFFMAEQYIRWLSKSKFVLKDKIIKHMLDICYTNYQDLFISVFNQFKDSEKFLKCVHDALKGIEFKRLEKILETDYMPLEINKQGFIHVLADDISTENEVWWGEKRFE